MACLAALLLASCVEKPPALSLEPVSFAELPGWNADHLSEAVPAFVRSCAVLAQKPPESPAAVANLHLQLLDWKPACAALAQLPPQNDAAARAYFEKYFQPYAASGRDGAKGLFTGYYEAELRGARAQGGPYQTPLYARPRDLITVDLGDFEPASKGKRIEGKVVSENLKPYDDRTEIENNSLQNRAEVLLWVDSPVDAFFLAVQGSGRVILPDGSVVRVGYAATNGHDYVAIGRVMEEAGDIPKPVTMQAIRAWLAAHPDKARTVMDTNPSYVFFRILEGEGPVGAEGVALTPRRSLAVDPAFIRLGTPIWLDTMDARSAALQRLMIAQDTGGAIKGPIRGDFFWGSGADAEAEAGAMQSEGKYYLLLPKSAAPAS
jgi:membrane-bound lytic murein transglycosylase A